MLSCLSTSIYNKLRLREYLLPPGGLAEAEPGPPTTSGPRSLQAGVNGAKDWVQQLTDVANVCDQWLESLA